MSNDMELLELAAKAPGIETYIDHEGFRRESDSGVIFDPLHDDGCAFRLATKLDISLPQQFAMVVAEYPCVDAEFNERNTLCEGVLDDHCASSRRAIVRAAAAMAKTTA